MDLLLLDCSTTALHNAGQAGGQGAEPFGDVGRAWLSRFLAGLGPARP